MKTKLKSVPKKTKKVTKVVEKKVVAAKPNYVYAVGRRKTATARVRLYSGKGETLVNEKSVAEYFPGETARVLFNQPFQVTKTEGRYYATIKVEGSGKSGQVAAAVHGLARALDKDNHDLYHPALKASDLLTRDSRERERRKPGLGGKARRQKQSPKR